MEPVFILKQPTEVGISDFPRVQTAMPSGWRQK